MTAVVFWILAGLAILGALACITRKSPLASALWLVLTLFALSGLYVVLDAPFIAAIQVLVYAGAIMVLFLVVIMLLNLGAHQGPADLRGWPGRVVALLVGVGLLVELWALRGLFQSAGFRLPEGTVARLAEQQGVVDVVAQPLFREFLVPFEITSVLLLAAAVGAVVLAKRKL